MQKFLLKTPCANPTGLSSGNSPRLLSGNALRFPSGYPPTVPPATTSRETYENLSEVLSGSSPGVPFGIFLEGVYMIRL